MTASAAIRKSAPPRGMLPRASHPDSSQPLEACPALVLNADYTPLSYYPLSLWAWQTAIKAVFLDRVSVVAQYQRRVSSPTFQIQLPSVIALRTYVKPAAHPAFTRFNLFLRDKFACQYCGDTDALTFDHVIPRAYGGRTTWENVTTACAPCNLAKGGRTPREAHMELFMAPRRPTTYELQTNGRAFPHRHCHESWRDFLYWDVELES